MTSYDVARQMGKVYMGALNTGEAEFAALFAPGARVTVGGTPADPAAVRAATPPGRSAFRGARLDAGQVVWTVRVRDATSVEDREHRAVVDDAGRITELHV